MTTTRTRITKARSSEQRTLDLAAPPTREDVEPWRLTDLGSEDGVALRQLDVPETIPALGYGSHQFFRYYGKFPSIVGREIVRHFPPIGGPVLDCYAGSGTTLVEAQIAGHASAGIDINPLAVLASNVKTAYMDHVDLAKAVDDFLAGVGSDPGWRPVKPSLWVGKWFSERTAADLASLRARLEDMQDHPSYDFLTLAFLAIVRRVSTAFDGEVRPHFNKDKRERDVFEAFELKALDNIAGLRDLDRRRTVGVPSRSLVGDNRDAASYAEVLQGEQAGLVVAHPPYLNSFNYLAAFSLELAWSQELSAVWPQGLTEKNIMALEQKAWPALNEAILQGYYSALFDTMKAATSSARSGAYVGVVVGDATIRGVLEPVHLKVWEGLQEQGLIPSEIWYRTTHYGIGKYAYSTRADYHGQAEKKDAILFLQVP